MKTKAGGINDSIAKGHRKLELYSRVKRVFGLEKYVEIDQRFERQEYKHRLIIFQLSVGVTKI